MADSEEQPPSNARMVADLQAAALLFRMFSMDELRTMLDEVPATPDPAP